MFYRGDTRVRFATAIVLLLSMLLLLPWLGETWFNSKGEPREAIVAVTMLQSGDWVLPLSFGSDMPYKPPLLAWMIAAAAWLFNGGVVNEYLSRLPSALAAIALIMAGFAWARRERGDRFAIVMSIVTLTCFEVFRAAMACRVDMVLTACMVIPVYILYRIREDRRGKGKFAQWLAAWALLTGAVLAKGPVGSLLPCMAMGIFFLFRGERFFPTLLRMLSLALAAMLLPAVWYYAAWLRGGDAFLDLMLEENIGRLTGQMSYESHEQPFYYNFITLIAGCLPWTLMVLMAATTLRKARRTPLKPAGMLALTVAVAVVAFYCIPSSKRSVYLLPAYPFVCYAIASIADSETARPPLKWFTWLFSVLAIAVPLVFTALYIFPQPALPLAAPHWYGWIALAVPPALGIAWMINRHSPAGHLLLTVWSLYLAYIACVMPAVLNPRSDRNLIPTIDAGADTAILILQPPADNKYRLFTLDFYYNDRLRPVENVQEAGRYPRGTVLLYPHYADTTGLTPGFTHGTLTPRGCDHRHALGFARKK